MASRRIMATAGLMMAGVACAVAAKPPEPGFWLTGLAPGTTQGAVTSLTQDGQVAAGWSVGLVGGKVLGPGFTWTSSGGRNDFGFLAGMPATSGASSINNLGIIVGVMSDGNNLQPRAYLWTGSGPLQDLGLLPGETRSSASDLSDDGNVVVGHAEHGTWTYYTGQAFRWTPTQGMQGLGYAKAGDFLSDARAVSRDGKAIVGISGPIGTDAFVWTEAGGMKILPKLPNPTLFDTHANGVNADGSVVVGDSPHESGFKHAVRWVNGQVEDLATFGAFSTAYAVSDNGAVVGGAFSASPSFGFVWTEVTGMREAHEYLGLFGMNVPSPYQIEYVYAISGDGLTFGGQAKNQTTGVREGFVATVPAATCKADCDASGELDIDDFICFQTRFAISDPYADCDASGGLDIDDFICFQTLFAIGCQG